MWDWVQGQDNDGIKSIRWGNRRTVSCTHRQVKSLFSLTVFMDDDRCNFFLKLERSFTWLFFLQKAKGCYGKVLSAWFLFCGGREWVRQPDGRSLWFSRWLFCVVLSDTGQAHWHAASLPTISSPPLPSPPPPTQSLLRRWIPALWPLQILRGWDGTFHLAHQRKCQCLGSYWWHPFATVKSS